MTSAPEHIAERDLSGGRRVWGDCIFLYRLSIAESSTGWILMRMFTNPYNDGIVEEKHQFCWIFSRVINGPHAGTACQSAPYDGLKNSMQTVTWQSLSR